MQVDGAFPRSYMYELRVSYGWGLHNDRIIYRTQCMRPHEHDAHVRARAVRSLTRHTQSPRSTKAAWFPYFFNLLRLGERRTRHTHSMRLMTVSDHRLSHVQLEMKCMHVPSSHDCTFRSPLSRMPRVLIAPWRHIPLPRISQSFPHMCPPIPDA